MDFPSAQRYNSLMENHIATATTTISAPIRKVWNALVDPQVIKQYMFGTDVVSDWKEGDAIVWKGEWQGKPYEDRGVIKKIEPEHLIQYTHFSPLEGKPDVPENNHTITIELSSQGDQTAVTLSQDNNATAAAQEHSEKMWQMMLDSMKKVLE